MTSLYQQTIPVEIKWLGNLSAILKKAEEHCAASGTKPEDMLNSKLAPDMRPLIYYAQCCCNSSKFLVARVGEHENIYFPDDETTFEQIQARITTTIKILESVDAKGFNGKETQPIIMELKVGKFKFRNGQAYVSEYALPYFHGNFVLAFNSIKAQGVNLTPYDHYAGMFEKVE